MSAASVIGGFFPLALDALGGSGRLGAWGVGPGEHVAFHNARSALHHLLGARRRPGTTQRMWLPSFICADAASAAEGTGFEVAFYPVDTDLAVDVGSLDGQLAAGDVAVGVDHFGRPADPALRALAARRRDVAWVEDRAQALAPGEPWADHVLRSPRKLVGVADGGILTGAGLGDPGHRWEPGTEFADAALARFEDRDERADATWYPRYVEGERRMVVSRRPMSRLTATILDALDLEPVAARRLENHRVLHERCGSSALWPDADPASEGWVPMGFVVRVGRGRRDDVASALHAVGIYAAVHWRTLPAPAAGFPAAWELADQLLTVPCDQRYDAADMARVATELAGALR